MSFALIETHVSRLPAFVKWCLSCAILEGLRGTNGVADSVSSASCGRPATGPAAAAQNFGALVVPSLVCNATGKLARFPAPFSSDLPGLFVACDNGHETYPFAPGMATSTGRGERGRVTGSECRAAGFGIIGTAARRRPYQPRGGPEPGRHTDRASAA